MKYFWGLYRASSGEPVGKRAMALHPPTHRSQSVTARGASCAHLSKETQHAPKSCGAGSNLVRALPRRRLHAGLTLRQDEREAVQVTSPESHAYGLNDAF
jgi:hypothetical protein